MTANLKRQQHNIELIASENIVSKAVLLAAGGVLTNKYAEGYPGKRYYGGCGCVDVVENIARDRAKGLFRCRTRQCSASQRAPTQILRFFFALLNPGDTVMGMNLSQGGHLSHGSPLTFRANISMLCPTASTPSPSRSTMTKWKKIALECKPKMIVSGASAYSHH